MGEVFSVLRQPLVLGNKTYADITDDVCGPLEKGASLSWWIAFIVSVGVLILGALSVAYQVMTGVGVWGLNNTVGWAFDITNFVFWIGIGHAGTLISAILFLFRQRWRPRQDRRRLVNWELRRFLRRARREEEQCEYHPQNKTLSHNVPSKTLAGRKSALP